MADQGHALRTIDGTEGGGQICRNASAYALLLRLKIRLMQIRRMRENAGLGNQHLAGLLAIAEIGATIKKTGTEDDIGVGTLDATIDPHEYEVLPEYTFDIGTAGCITLVFQNLLPVLLFSKTQTKLTVKGGTDGLAAPLLDYVDNVLRPMLELFGIHFKITEVKRGFYPKGNGSVTFLIKPVLELTAINLTERGEIVRISGSIVASTDIAENTLAKMKQEIQNRVSSEMQIIPEIEIKRCETDSPGCNVTLWAETTTGMRLGGSALMKRGVKIAKLAELAATDLLTEIRSGACVDKWLQDQLIIFAFLANGTTEYFIENVEEHTTTALEVGKQMTGAEYEIVKVEDLHLVKIHGISFRK